MKLTALAAALVAAPLLTMGCAPPELATAQTISPSGGTNPLDDFKQKKLETAMRGLNYDSGSVQVDPGVANQIAKRGTRGQAIAQLKEAEILLNEKGWTLEAIAAFTKAVIIDPTFSRSYYELGRALTTKGKMSESAASYRTALSLEPTLPAARFRLAEAYQSLGDAASAQTEWKKLATSNPGYEDTLSRLAILSYYDQDYKSAWIYTLKSERLNKPVPPQFRELLQKQMPEPQVTP